ncbi:Zn-dependent protease with chaperone function [Defluviimonas denitrificans]|uniref:Zn-dependent protease with chaperone function n=2 Tax=Albidovulum denitrificans TaxID=404881 RepID=A0A2S8S5U7_9RHOB|nr:Zn-dependent protease with chaperone function [Defluviimonas denitrificans]
MCEACNPARTPQRYRHRWEMPMVVTAWMISLLAVGVSLTATDDIVASARANDVEWLLNLGYLVLFTPIMALITRFYRAAKERSNGIKVGPQQFSHIWDIYTDLLTRFDLPTAPALYVVNGNGAVNAYAMSCSLRRKYVVLNAEIAGLGQHDPELVRFVLAHELAHHKLGHVALVRISIAAVMHALFLPGKAMIRAQEYSADRLAMAVCPEAADTLVFLSVGPWMAQQLNAEAYVDQMVEDSRGLMVRVVNMASDHAVMSKRYKALRDIAKHGFDKHGEMF